jgi:F-type H+-transporting ATPase subunit b
VEILSAHSWAHGLLLLAAETAAEAAGAEEGGLFNFDLTLALQIVQFFVLLFVLNLFFYRPISRVIEERSEYIRSNATSAQRRLDEAKELAERYGQELRSTRLEAQQAIAQAEAEAQRIRAQQVGEAQREAMARVESARAELESQKRAALASLDREIDALSAQLADKLLGTARRGG